MTRDELYERKNIAVERYGTGYILADYSGNRGEASYRGVVPNWRKMPIVSDPFPSVEAAIAAAQTEPDGPSTSSGERK